jgi:drug/metabolite transporter (DMT)-like permease
MSITNPIGNLQTSGVRPTTGPVLALTGALAATLAAAAVLQPSIAREALVPAAATLLLIFAAAVTLVAWLRPVPRRHFTYWDAAGVLTFIGICAAATVEPEQMVQLVAGTERPR